MKFRIVAAAALIVCSLYGCGNNNTSTSSLYTPAPITPRPTFDTTHYRTKEEMTAKVSEDFVIASVGVDTSGPYPSKESEYISVFTEKSSQIPAKKTTPTVSSTTKNISYSSNVTNNTSTTQNTGNDSSADTYEPTVVTTPAPQLTPRPAYATPSGFSSKNYPYSIYSFDGRTYLGDVTMNSENENSIYNVEGAYGSPDSTTSIYNTYGIYGSSNSMFSAFNDYATAPPKIYDSKGNLVGLLSSNLIHSEGISPDELKAYIERNGL